MDWIPLHTASGLEVKINLYGGGRGSDGKRCRNGTSPNYTYMVLKVGACLHSYLTLGGSLAARQLMTSMSALLAHAMIPPS